MPDGSNITGPGMFSEVGTTIPQAGIPAGPYKPTFGVQNSSTSGNTLNSDIVITVEELNPGGNFVTRQTETVNVSLVYTEEEFLFGPVFEYGPGDYKVTIEIAAPDAQPINDKNVFRFVVY